MDIDSNSLRIFCGVIETKSFSGAAKKLKISQPSVSQMISRLETKLGSRLFERIGHSVVPTRLANDLHNFASSWVEQLDTFFETMTLSSASPSGKVHFAKPESFIWTPNYEAILSQLQNLRDIQIDIDLLTNQQVIDGVLSDKYDFGFIVGEKISSDLRFERFSAESYVAVQSYNIKEPPTFEKGSTLRIVSYPGWEEYFKLWASHHGLLKKIQRCCIKPVVHVGNLAGAIKAITQGSAFGVLPLQCISHELKENSIRLLDPDKTPASAPVYLVRRRASKPPIRVEVVLKVLRSVATQ